MSISNINHSKSFYADKHLSIVLYKIFSLSGFVPFSKTLQHFTFYFKAYMKLYFLNFCLLIIRNNHHYPILENFPSPKIVSWLLPNAHP